MAMDFFIYQVNRRWYRAFWGGMLAFSLALAILYVSARFLPSLEQYTDMFYVSTTSFALSCFSILYLTTIYWFAIRYSLPFATLVGSMIFFLVLMYGFSNTLGENGAWLYVAPWVATVFLGGMLGVPLVASSAFVTVVCVLLLINFDPGNVSTDSLVLMLFSIAAAEGAARFWKNKFASVENQKLSQLSGMLRSNQLQSVTLVQSIADGVIVVDTEGRITLINPAAAKMTGWTIADAMGVDAQLVASLSHEDNSEIVKEENPFTVVFSEKKPLSQIAQVTGKDGAKHVVSLVISPIIVDTALSGAVAIMRDISEERAAEKQRAEFISTASHEMRTPVAAIEGYLALALNEKVSTIDTRARSYLEKAHSSTQHLGKLFQDLLTSSRAEDGRLSNHPAVVEMGAFLQQLTDDLKFAAEKKGLLAEFVIGGADDTIDATTKDAAAQHLLKPLYYVHVDPDRVREVITNLFDNAVKYTDSGKISIGLTGNAEVVQMYVRDTGAGIPKEDTGHLFQKFYRVDNSATRTIGGTGLGLFICRKIVELYNGRIWVESEVGKGSTFFINLPRLTTQRAAEIQETEEEAKATIAAATKPTTPNIS